MALGVVFGLAMSLILKHSSLNHYPQIETCLVALSAYTCYFFSNGIHMSGIVSLLFCGITLKHYAYHTMSRRTQRATKYIFSTLAQLSENFIFIYLGLSLFTSPPSSAKVTSYFKPLFIIVTTVAVVFTRYAAVFPLSEMINLFHRHARGQRQEELPHSYQMMLFWAGLRGAVGVALAAGFKGDNAQSMRTTVLVVVVLTVVVFGGTTARMLEVLGIRTGVEDDDEIFATRRATLAPGLSRTTRFSPPPHPSRTTRTVGRSFRSRRRRSRDRRTAAANRATAPRRCPHKARTASGSRRLTSGTSSRCSRTRRRAGPSTRAGRASRTSRRPPWAARAGADSALPGRLTTSSTTGPRST